MDAEDQGQSDSKTRDDVQLCARLFVRLHPGKASINMVLNYGQAGKQGLHGVVQYLKNKSKGL